MRSIRSRPIGESSACPDTKVRKMSGAAAGRLATISLGGEIMRHKFARAAAFGLLVGTTAFLAAQSKGERATIRGEVVDLWCYLEAGDRGPAKKECATACAKAGNPIGILDSKGTLYIAASLEDH